MHSLTLSHLSIACQEFSLSICLAGFSLKSPRATLDVSCARSTEGIKHFPGVVACNTIVNLDSAQGQVLSTISATLYASVVE